MNTHCDYCDKCEPFSRREYNRGYNKYGTPSFIDICIYCEDEII